MKTSKTKRIAFVLLAILTMLNVFAIPTVAYASGGVGSLTFTCVSGTVFNIKNSSGTIWLENIVMPESGTITISNIPVGSYTLNETQATPYHSTPNPYSFTIVANGTQTINYTELGFMGYLYITGNPGAVYQVYRGDTACYSTLTIPASGTAMYFTPQYSTLGYSVKEVTPASGYASNPTPISFNVYEDGIYIDINFTERALSGSLTIKGKSGDTFDICNKKTSEVTRHNVIVPSSGTITVSLPLGVYNVVETAAGPYYALPNTVTQEITIGYDGYAVTATYYDNSAQGYIQITGTPGTVFQAYCAATNFTTMFDTGESGTGISRSIPAGTYIVTEVGAYTPTGYRPNTQQLAADIVSDQQTVSLTLYLVPYQGSIVITATPGAVFTVKQGTTVEQDDITIPAAGSITLNSILLGDYTVVQKTAAPGRTLNVTSQSASIQTDNQTISLTFTDSQAHGNIAITGIPGAVFQVKTGSTVICDNVTIPVGGSVTETGLPAGNYTVAEITPATGYVLNDPQQANITIDGQTISLTFSDSVIQGHIDITGDPGSIYQIKQGSITVLDNITIPEEGSIQSDLPYGDYTVLQKSPASGYTAITTPQDANITTDGQVVSLNFTGIFIQGTISIKGAPGAVYQIKQGTTVIYDNVQVFPVGAVDVTYVPFGNYSVVEKTPAEGYLLNSTAQDANITTNGQKVVLTFTDSEIQGSISISALPGSVYQVKQGSTVILDDVTVPEVGTIKTSDLPYGSYSVVEKTPATGYNANTTAQDAVITTDGQIVSLNFENTVIKGSIEITAPPSAVFQIKQGENVVRDNITIGDECVATETGLPYGEYTIVEKTTPKGYAPNTGYLDASITTEGQKVSFTINYVVAIGSITITAQPGSVYQVKQGNKVILDDVTVPESGTIKTSDLSYGSYSVVEKTPATGYNPNTMPQDADIATDGQVVSLSFENTAIKGSIEITGIPGTVYQVKQGSKVILDDVTVAESGTIKTSDLTYGSYSVVEKTPATGYNPNTTSQDADIATDGQVVSLTFENTAIKGSIEITGIPGTVYQVKQGSKVILDNVTVPESGTIKTSDLTYGSYTVVEKTPATGYKPNVTPQDADITTDGQVVSLSFDNAIIKGSIAIKATPGAVFTVKQGSTVVQDNIAVPAGGTAMVSSLNAGTYAVIMKMAAAGHTLNSTAQNATIDTDDQTVTLTFTDAVIKGSIAIKATPGAVFTIKQGTTVIQDNITVPAGGTATVTSLNAGTYSVIMKTAAAGHTLNTTPQDATIDTDDQTVTLTFTDAVIKGSISIKATPGAVFTVKQGTTVVQDNIAVPAGGTATVSSLNAGTYAVIMKTAAAGHTLNSTAQNATIATNGQTVTLTFTDAVIKGSIAIKATPGAVFTVKQGTTVVQDNIAVPAGGTATVSSLNAGTYAVIMKTAAAGHTLNSTAQNATIVTNGQTVTLTFADAVIKGSIAIKATPGAVFTIKQGTTVIQDNIAVPAGGTATVSSLNAGTYAVIMKTAAAGHTLNSTAQNATIASNGQTVTLTFTDSVIKGSIAIKATPGTVFTIKQGTTVIQDNITIPAAGTMTVTSLIAGTYTVVEKAAPSGYNLNTVPQSATITTNGQTITLTFVNTKIVPLPVITGLKATPTSFAPGGTNVMQITGSTQSGIAVSLTATIKDAKGNVVAVLNRSSQGGAFALSWDGKATVTNASAKTKAGTNVPVSDTGTNYTLVVTATNSKGTANSSGITLKLYVAAKITGFAIANTSITAGGSSYATIGFKASTTTNIEVDIMNAAGKIVAKYSYTNWSANTAVSIKWNGLATADNTAGLKAGANVTKGIYKVQIIACGVTTKPTNTITVK